MPGKLILLVLCIWLAVSAVEAQSLPPTFFGMNVLHAINKTPWPDAPIASIRLWDTDDTSWPAIEPARGKFNFDGLDRWLALAKKHNVDVLYTFGRVPGWANGNQPQSMPPTDLKDWDDFVRAVVRHAKGRIHAYELWSEPNQPNFWCGDVKTLIEMSRRAYAIIKQEQPDAIVTTPSPTWDKTPPWPWLDQYFAAGGGKYADVIAFHGYVGTSPEAIVNDLENIRRVSKSADINNPIWDTESGWGIDAKLPDANQQAAFLARSYILHVSQGVHRFYWYAWDGSDGGSTPPDKSWGTLWNRDGTRAPGKALATVTAWLKQAKLPVLCTTDHSVWKCELNDSSLLIWDTISEHPYPIDTRFSQFRDLSNSVHAIPADRKIMIGTSPILLTSK